MKLERWSVIGVPIDCIGQDGGVAKMPAAFRSAGLLDELHGVDEGDLSVTLNDPTRDAETGIIGFRQVCAVSSEIKQAIEEMLQRGERPFVVGGCCTLLIGVCAALKSHFGEYGLAFVDGHLDFYDGKSSPKGETADMELAVITGHGPSELVNLVSPGPLVQPKHTVAIGFRDEQQAAHDGAPNPREIVPEMLLIDLNKLRVEGTSQVAARILERFNSDPGRFWLHLDVDVLDREIMPAVDYLLDDGLQWEELKALLQPLAESPALIGVDVTILNPDLDPNGECTEKMVAFLGEIFGKP